MRTKHKIINWFNILGIPEEHSRIDKRPSPLQLWVACIRHPKRISSLFRTFVATRVEPYPKIQTNVLPKIEALIVATEKDFETLKCVIQNLPVGSLNKISKVTVITPEKSVRNCKNLTKELRNLYDLGIDVLNEDDYFTDEFRKGLKSAFGLKYGWIYQQLLKLQYVFMSEFAGVLVIDSDTVLLQERAWLDSTNKQLLLVSAEFNKPYYVFLNSLFGTKIFPKHTFVAHHMLMQPIYLREILKLEDIQSVDEIGVKAIFETDKSVQSPASIDYEVYGQLMAKHFPHLLSYGKFGNIGVPIPQTNFDDFIGYLRESESLFSVSFHSYL